MASNSNIPRVACLALSILILLFTGCDLLPTEPPPAPASTYVQVALPTTTTPTPRLVKLVAGEFKWLTDAPINNSESTWEVKPGEARFVSTFTSTLNDGHSVSYFMNWTEPPDQFMEGDTITFTAGVRGQIDVQRERLLPFEEASFKAICNWGLGDSDIGAPLYLGPQYNPTLAEQKETYSLKIPIRTHEINSYMRPETPTFVIRFWVYLPGAIGAYDFTYGYVSPDENQEPAPEELTGPAPLVFIPGVTGSHLAGNDGHILWPPEGPGASRGLTNRAAISKDFTRLSLNPATGPHENINAIDVIRADGKDMYYGPLLDYLTSEGGYVEYRVNNDPLRRTAAGFDMYQKDKNPSLFVFAYDWRLSSTDNARALADYIAGINRMYPETEVDILAHSMGGLIARRYIIDNPGKVGRLITIATPFLGSPKPLYQMIYGTTGTGFMDDVTWLLFGDELKEMLAYYPGVHELMASRMYFALGGQPYAALNAVDLAPGFVDYIPLMGNEGIVDKLFSRPSYSGKTPAQSNNDFHSYTNNGNNQDDWSNDTTGVMYYHIIGEQSSGDTPLTLQQNNMANSATEWRFTRFGPGDGTVPVLSAERIGADGRNLNANGSTIIFAEGDDDLLEHTGLVNNTDVQRRVLGILTGE